MEKIIPGRQGNVVHTSIDLPAEAQLPVLEEATRALVERHESLRTRFPLRDDLPFQEVFSPGSFDIHLHVENEIDANRRLSDVEAASGFVLEAAPPCRFTVTEAGRAKRMIVEAHRIACDASLAGLLRRDLIECVKAALKDVESALPTVRWQARDYSRWEVRNAARMSRNLRYWIDTLTEAPSRPIFSDCPEDVITSQPPDVEFTFGIRTRDCSLEAAAVRHHVPPLALVLATFLVAISRFTDEDYFLVCIPFENRKYAELDQTVANLAQLVWVRSTIDRGASAEDLVRDLSARAISAFHRCEYDVTSLFEYSHKRGHEQGLAHNWWGISSGPRLRSRRSPSRRETRTDRERRCRRGRCQRRPRSPERG